MPRRTIWSLLAAALLCLAMLPVTALAADNAPEELVVGNVAVNVTQDGYWTTDPATGELTVTQDPATYNVRYDADEATLYLRDATIGKSTSLATGTHSIYAFGESGVSITIHLAGESNLSSGVPVYVTSDTGNTELNIVGGGRLNAEGTAWGNGGIFLMSGAKMITGGGSYLNITNGAEVVSNCPKSTAVMFYTRPGGEAILTVMGASLTANGWYPTGDARGIFFSRLDGTGTANFYLRFANNAVVRANRVAVLSGHTLQHQYNSASGGMYFNGNAGTVYGSVTPQEDLSIGEGETLTIGQGSKLTIPEGSSLINEGTVTGAGSIVNNGTIYRGDGATLPNGITGSGTIKALPAYAFECPGELELQESSGGYYTAKGALSLTDDPVLGEDGRIIVYATYSAVTRLQNEEDQAYSIPLYVDANDGSSTCYFQSSNEIRVISVFDGGQSAPYTLCAYADPMDMNDVPNGTYGGTITLYVGYAKDPTVQFGDTATVDLDTLEHYTVEVTLENTLGLSVVNQPQAIEVIEGETASFSVTANGGTTKTYQWQVSANDGASWTDIDGAADAIYTTPATTMDMDGNQYRCVVTSGQVTIESDPATLTVNHVHKPAGSWSSDEGGHWHACAACGDKLDYDAHTTEVVDKQKPTCTEDGYTGDTVCPVCDRLIEKGETDPATGHAWGAWGATEPATCTEDGLEARTCATCGETETRTVSATGHSFTSYVSNRDATCTEDGTETAACDNGCGATDTRADEGSALGHELERVDAIPATCTEPGTREHWECARCDALFADEDGKKPANAEELAIPATGHSPAAAWSSDTDGHWHACENGCGTKLDAAAHEPETTGEKDATCTDEGYIGDMTCATCGYVIAKGEKVPATGHSWGAWDTTEPATCEKDGLETRACEACGEEETRSVPPLGHDFENGVCTVCGVKEEGYVAPEEPEDPEQAPEPSDPEPTLPETGDATASFSLALGVLGAAALGAGALARRRG